MSATPSHSEQQHWPEAELVEDAPDPLTSGKPPGTRVVVEAGSTEQRFEAEVCTDGIVRDVEDGAPVEDDGHEIVRTKSAFNRAGDWHYNERDADGNIVSESTSCDGGHAELQGTDKMDSVAHGILKDNAPSLCPIAMEFFDSEMELGEAEAFPPRVDGKLDVEYEHRFEPRPYRVNEEYGYIPGGPIIGNRPIQEFQLDVWAVLEGAVLLWENTRKNEHGIDYETAGDIWDRAMALKRSGGPHDQTIMAKVAAWISDPQLLEFEA